MIKKMISLFLVICMIGGLLLGMHVPVHAADSGDISLFDMQDSFSNALDAAEAVSYLTEGDVDKFLEIMSGLGVDAVGEMALGSLFSIGTLAAESAVAITNWALDYNIENRYQEYREKRFASINSINDLTAKDVREWIERGRAEFDQYWTDNIRDGAVRVKYINEVKERRLEDFGYSKWLWAKLNPFSDAAKKYNGVMNDVISDTTIADYVFEDWEKEVLKDAYKILPPKVKEASARKLKETSASIRGYISFSRKPSQGNYYDLYAEDGKKNKYSPMHSGTMTEETNIFRIDIPIERLILNDAIKICIKNTTTNKEKIVKEIPVKELLSVPTDLEKDANTGLYMKRFDAQTISETIRGSSDGASGFTLRGILPSGKQVEMTINNIIKFFKPQYMVNTAASVSNRAGVEYSDEGNLYYAVTEIPEDESDAIIQFGEPPVIVTPASEGELVSALSNENDMVASGQISFNQYNSRVNEILSRTDRNSVSYEKIEEARVNVKADLQSRAQAVIAKYQQRESQFASKYKEISDGLNNEYNELVNIAPNIVLYSIYIDDYPIFSIQEMLDRYDQHKGDYYSHQDSIVRLLRDLESLDEDFAEFATVSTEESYNLFSASGVGYTIGNNAQRPYIQYNSADAAEETFKEERDEHAARKKALEDRIVLIRENSDKVKKELTKNYEKLKAIEEYKISKLEGYKNSIGTDWDKHNNALGAFFGTANDYYRCLNDNIQDGIVLWGNAFKKSIPDGIRALNRVNRYFGGTVYNEDFLKKNGNDLKVVLPLLEGVRNMAKVVEMPNPYIDKNAEILTYYDANNLSFKWLWLGVEDTAKEGGSPEEAAQYIRKITMPDFDALLRRKYDAMSYANCPANPDYLINGILKEFDKDFYNIETAPGKDTDRHWAKNEINLMLQKGYVKAVAQNTFEPNMPITRKEFCQFLALALGLPLEGYKGSFTDVPELSQYAPYIEASSKAGIVGGTGKGEFSPDAYITREQIAVMSMKALAYASKKSLAELSVASELKFKDSKDISSWALEYVKAAAKQGILTGKSDNTYQPKDNASRGEAAVIIKRLAEKMGK